MIVRTLDEVRNTDRHMKSDNWDSVRLSLKDDGMGFSFHITTIKAGTETHIHYKNHLETVYCISGDGEVQTLADNKVYKIVPGTVYILDQHDEHMLRGGKEDMVVACAFNPPLSGQETHDADGVYQIAD
ncbi:ectoine synthase [Hydrocarboniclastica marina]|uniref:L-ectoine synthase n=1 Tax=Hydrocarboniclastica marina TaxID=2259620 RepID=A0A4P7XDV6_9ALTE|nr:ectoine synthase [Hydrocarboniclastica marina]MAL97925.1 L-ectoine synthase [Alteromonadaceae bacterium]QCF24554.1 ectoine synthase [Hydrocarboniclastica marina]|tara:strand:+ start:1843 stop:2229 length:387 start_codon:yes stop_codon:yes gene_type:complete